MVEPVLHIDFETRSAVDLREVGLYNYARHPTTDVWCMAWAIGDMEPALIPVAHPDHKSGLAPWVGHVRNGGKVYAHNAPFELAIWNNIMVPRYGWPELKPEQTYCTMAMAYAMGLPGSLEDAALAMGIDMKKDIEGRALMLRMCRPRSTKGGDIVWWDDEDKLARLYEYCKQDVRVERELHKRLMPLSDRERQVWLMDYRINQRGVQVDLPSANAAIKLADAMKVRYDNELAEITNGAATSVTALAPLKEWLNEQGCHQALAGLAKADVSELLARNDLPAAARAALTVRQEAGKASNAKFNVMALQAGEDGRLHNLVQYHGAATGRWAGRAVQVHNLPRNMPDADVVERILELVRNGEHDAIDAIFGPPLTMVSSCLRSFFTAAPGKRLVAGDFSNVEARGAAWMAGEQWKIEAFIAQDHKTGPDVYRLGASKLLGVAVEAVTPEQRQSHGKVPDLAFQYQGSVGSGRTMGKTYGVFATDDEWRDRCGVWRAAHPRIVRTWYDIQGAAIRAVENLGNVYECGAAGRQAKFRKVGSFLWCLLPSGRAICYPYPKILQGEFGPQLTYMTLPSPDDRRKGKIVYDPLNSSNWARVSTYGGSLFNNIVQGMCRDILAETMLNMEAAGLPVVLHVHDEAVGEGDEAIAEEKRLVMQQMMRTPPAWAKGFPLWADCKVMVRYGK